MRSIEDEIAVQNLINKCFGGCKERYEQAQNRSMKDTLSFKDLASTCKVYPEYESLSEDIIREYLGYCPVSLYTIKYQPHIRGLINQFRIKAINSERFHEELHQCMMLMRNQIVHDDAIIAYRQQVYQSYADLSQEKKDRIRQRFERYLGYEPKLETSINWELILTNHFERTLDSWPVDITPFDFQALTVIKYREVFLAQGKNKADLSPVPVLDIRARLIALQKLN